MMITGYTAGQASSGTQPVNLAWTKHYPAGTLERRNLGSHAGAWEPDNLQSNEIKGKILYMLQWFFSTFFDLQNVQSVQSIDLFFARAWASQSTWWVVIGCAIVFLMSILFYRYSARRTTSKFRWSMAILRGLILALLVFILADPVLTIAHTKSKKPLLFVLFDATESMALRDQYTDSQQEQLKRATRMPEVATSTTDTKKSPTRTEYIQSLLRNKEKNFLSALSEKYSVRAFQLQQLDSINEIISSSSKDNFPTVIASQLKNDGKITNLSAAIDAINHKHTSNRLAAVVIVSDFNHNASGRPLTGEKNASVRQIQVPIYTVGIGPEVANDLSVDLQVRPLMRVADSQQIFVTLSQSGLTGKSVEVVVQARRRKNPQEKNQSDQSQDKPTLITKQTIPLDAQRINLKAIEYIPQDAGEYEITVDVAQVVGESVVDNNHDSRKVTVVDNFLRILYVEYEPTWEWQFIKEVFHRDQLVGPRGFRTYLDSSDPKVRQSNDLFVKSLTPPGRADFFANDVIFLGDMPFHVLSPRFCALLKEYVRDFGGGLVIVTGPRFGPSQLAATELRDMLPVILYPEAEIRDQQEFQLQRTIFAENEKFMNLGENQVENEKAWKNLGPLPWYQPVLRPHSQAIVLAEHPTDKCSDGKTPQPIIAIRKYGAGEVVYVGTNEMWRLRKRYGEKYYTKFWGQMMKRLGLRHDLGDQKRFHAYLNNNQTHYAEGDQVVVTVDAYNENFEPLAAEDLVAGKLTARVHLPSQPGEISKVKSFSLVMKKKGRFEATLSSPVTGYYSIEIDDPITKKTKTLNYQVIQRSLERRSAIRNANLQRAIAAESGGKAYDLLSVHRLVDEIETKPILQHVTQSVSLWNNWFCFTLIVGMLLCEWILRKMARLV